MKKPRPRLLLDLPDDVATEIIMIVTCCAVGIIALVYLVAI